MSTNYLTHLDRLMKALSKPFGRALDEQQVVKKHLEHETQQFESYIKKSFQGYNQFQFLVQGCVSTTTTNPLIIATIQDPLYFSLDSRLGVNEPYENGNQNSARGRFIGERILFNGIGKDQEINQKFFLTRTHQYAGIMPVTLTNPNYVETQNMEAPFIPNAIRGIVDLAKRAHEKSGTSITQLQKETYTLRDIVDEIRQLTGKQ